MESHNIGGGRALRIAVEFVALVILLLAGSASAATLTVNGVTDYMRIQDMLQISGRLEANGTHFELNNSKYLNMTLDSSEPVNITIGSAPKMVTMQLESASGPTTIKITLGGFVPLTSYNKYEDNYHNLVSFQTDINGNYTYTQELSNPHFVFIQPETGKLGHSDILATSYMLPRTIFIQDNATGGDCILVGTWNISSKTCTLTNDFASNIQIDNDSIVLDGNGHTITGNDTGNGVHLSGRSDVTIKDLSIKKFYNGIFLYSSSNNMLRSNNNELNNGDGISLWSSSNNNTLNNNNVSKDDGGIFLYSSSKNTLNNNNLSNNEHYGIVLSASSRNTLSNNNVLNNGKGYGIALASDLGIPDSPSNNNTLSYNNVSNNNFTGIALFFSSNNILSNNIASKNNASGIILYDSSSNNTLSNNDALNNNYNGISLNFSSNNNTLSNNKVSNNKNYGISLGDSSNNFIYNNYFNNMNNTFDNENNIWNITKTAGTNIIGGSWLGGNFWSDYAGKDINGDGLGDMLLPYNFSGRIANGGDYLPLVHVSSLGPEVPDITSFSPTTSIVSNNVGESRTFSITANQTVNVSWLINGTEVFNQSSITQSSYTNTSAALGAWNVSAIVVNENGSGRQTWVWTVGHVPTAGGSISGMKFNDLNGNGTRDIGEPGLANWTIVLTRPDGSNETTITNSDGAYMFSNLSTGNYTVAEVLVPGWIQTLPAAPGIYYVTLATGENATGIDFGNNLMSLPSGVNASREIEKESLLSGNSTNITVRISSDMIQALALQESIPAGWNLTRISDDADGFKNSTNEWVWSNVTPGVTKIVIYKITAPTSASIGTYYINGTISNSSGVIAIVGGDKIITFDIIAYYRRLGDDPNIVETADLLKAMDDWRSGTAPAGFINPITKQELFALINEWAMS